MNKLTGQHQGRKDNLLDDYDTQDYDAYEVQDYDALTSQFDVQDHEISDSEIPDAIRNFKGVPKKERVKATQQNSNFFLTYNPNVSYKYFKTTAERVKFSKKLIALFRNVGFNLGNKKFLKEFSNIDTRTTKLDSYNFKIEIGEKRGFIHVHAIVLFNGYAQLNIQRMKSFMDGFLSTADKKIRGALSYKLYHDPTKIMERYINKQQTTSGASTSASTGANTTKKESQNGQNDEQDGTDENKYDQDNNEQEGTIQLFDE